MPFRSLANKSRTAACSDALTALERLRRAPRQLPRMAVLALWLLAPSATALALLPGFVGKASALPLSALTHPGEPQTENDEPDARVIPAASFSFYFGTGHPYYNGYRGYPDRRPGWHPYQGFWFPPMAFGPRVIVRPRPYDSYAGDGSYHYRYCASRYRSYRAYDNTYQPYHGPRRQCRSPYWP